ncbi:MAG: hypothetical protein Tsb0027_02520 [Wenzhouxiangellaceae bacterium]
MNDLDQIFKLPNEFHKAGIIGEKPLRAIAAHMKKMEVAHTAETGSGQTTLLFSQLSPHHKVFTLEDNGDNSLNSIQNSEFLISKNVDFILGPSQKTLPIHEFKEELDVVLIDGPHAYPFPDLEYYYFYRHIRKGGLLILDDIQIPNIAFMFSFISQDDMFELIDIVKTTAFFKRTEAATFPVDQDNWWKQGFNSQDRKNMLKTMLENYQYNTGENPYLEMVFDISDVKVPSLDKHPDQYIINNETDLHQRPYLKRLKYVCYMFISLLISRRLAAKMRALITNILHKDSDHIKNK